MSKYLITRFAPCEVSKGFISLMYEKIMKIKCPKCGVFFRQNPFCLGDYAKTTIKGDNYLQSYCPDCGDMDPPVDDYRDHPEYLSIRRRKESINRIAIRKGKRFDDFKQIFIEELKNTYWRDDYIRKCTQLLNVSQLEVLHSLNK